MRRRGSDSLEGWFVAMISCLISTLMYGTAGLSSMLFVASISRYDTDRNNAAFPFILCNVLQAATGPFAGYFAKRFGERAVLVAGSVLAFTGIGTCFFAENITEVTIFWGIIFGIGFGFSTLLLPAIVNNFFFKHRSKALGMCFLGSPLGFLIFPPIFEVLLSKYGLSGSFLFICGINMQSLPLSMLLRQPDYKKDNSKHLLNSSIKKISYSSTGCTKTEQNHSFQNDDEGTINFSSGISFVRRNSLEFLRNQSSSSESNVENKYYTSNLNEKCLRANLERSKSVRSCERLRSHYEDLDKSCYAFKTGIPNSESWKTSGSLPMSMKSDLNHTNLKTHECKFPFDLSNSGMKHATSVPENIMKKPCAGEETDIMEETVSNTSYDKFSSIYFGTYQQQPRSVDIPVLSSNGKLNISNNMNVNKGNLYGNGYNSFSESSVISCVASATSVSPLIANAKQYYYNIESARSDLFVEDKNNKNMDISSIYKTSLLSVYCHPIFILMSIVTAIFNLQFSTLTTVIIDFARDHDIDPSNDKFIMICLSLMGACGMLGFGWVTDGGYLSRNRFASFLLFIGSVSVAVLPQFVGFTVFITVLAFWCVSQSSFVLLIPAIIAEYFDEDTQAVAVSACNVLCAPLYLIIPPLIGYFRDGQGSYDSIFYLLSALSLLNGIAVFLVPCIAKINKKDKS